MLATSAPAGFTQEAFDEFLAQRDEPAWLTRLRELQWHRRTGPVRVVAHNSYLINLASPDRTAWDRSVRLQRVDGGQGLAAEQPEGARLLLINSFAL